MLKSKQHSLYHFTLHAKVVSTILLNLFVLYSGLSQSPSPPVSDACCSLNVQNTTHCQNGVQYAIYLVGADGKAHYFKATTHELQVCDDGSLFYSGTALKNGGPENTLETLTFEITATDLASAIPAGSPKQNNCHDIDPNDWSFYQTITGTFTSSQYGTFQITRRGPAFQMGMHANQTGDGLGACGWFNITGNENYYVHGDINISLTALCPDPVEMDGPFQISLPDNECQRTVSSNTSAITILPIDKTTTIHLKSHTNHRHQISLAASDLVWEKSGQSVVQKENTGSPAQFWEIEKTGNGKYFIKNSDSKTYITLTADEENKCAFKLSPFTGKENQQFDLKNMNLPPQVEIDFCEANILSLHSNRALDITGASHNNGAKAIQWNLHGGTNQQFEFEQIGELTYRIKVLHSGKYLSLDPDYKVVQWDWLDLDNQKWTVHQNGNGAYLFGNRENDAFLQAIGENKANGALMHVAPYSGNESQWFDIEEIGCQEPLTDAGEIFGPEISCGPMAPSYEGTEASGGKGGTIQYQWQWQAPGQGWKNSSHATAKSKDWSPNLQTQNRSFRRLAKRSFSNEWIASNVIEFKIVDAIQKPIEVSINHGTWHFPSKEISVCEGQKITLSIDVHEDMYWETPYGRIDNEPVLSLPKPLTPSHQGRYTAFYPDENGCETSTTIHVLVLDPPVVEVEAFPATCDQTNGSIKFKFPDNDGRTHISFSKDGGESFPLKVPDNRKEAWFQNLKPGTYQLSVRWGNTDCPVDLEPITVENESKGYCCGTWPNPGQTACQYRGIRNTVDCETDKPFMFTFEQNGELQHYRIRWGNFREFKNGTALLKGRISDVNNNQRQFDIFLTLENRTNEPYPFIPNQAACRPELSPSSTYAYQTVYGVLKGQSDLKGACIDLHATGQPFMMGYDVNPYHNVEDLFGAVSQMEMEVNFQPQKGPEFENTTLDLALNLTGSACTNCFEKPKVQLIASDRNICTDDIVEIEAKVSGGSQPFRYHWNQSLPAEATVRVSPIQRTSYYLTVTDRLGCIAKRGTSINVKDKPVATWNAIPAVCGENNGEIHFSFEDHPDRTNIEFSLNGGQSYQRHVSDQSQIAIYDGLAPGDYHLFVRWGNNECPVDLGIATISNEDLADCCEPLFQPGHSVCARRKVYNTVQCDKDAPHILYLNINGQDQYFQLIEGSFKEYLNGSARLTGLVSNTQDITQRFEMDVVFTGRNWEGGPGSPHPHGCYGNLPDNDFNYYLYSYGVLTGRGTLQGACLKINNMGPAFQIGTGANIAHENESAFGGSGWFEVEITQQPITGNQIQVPTGDINMVLSGDACACNKDLRVAILTQDREVCLGNSTTLTANGMGGKAPYHYTWMHTTSSEAAQIITPEISTRYEVTVTDQAGCVRKTSRYIKVEAAPIVDVILDHPTCSKPNGEITFYFDDSPERTNIEFSLNGGQTYLRQVSDDIGSITYRDLEPKAYDLWVRWGNNECPVALGTYTLQNQNPENCCDFAPPIQVGKCATRTASNGIDCETGLAAAIPFSINGIAHSFYWESGSFVEHLDGSARLNGRLVSSLDNRYRFDIDWVMTGKTIGHLEDFDGVMGCQPIHPQIDLYYYTKGQGHLRGAGIFSGACFQLNQEGKFYLGNGMNGFEENDAVFGANASFSLTLQSFPLDFFPFEVDANTIGLNLSGDACACNNDLQVALEVESNRICKGEPLNLKVNVSGGLPPYSFEWNEPNETNSSLSLIPESSKRYRVTITDAKGCSRVLQKYIRVLDLPVVYYQAVNPECEFENGSITLFFEDNPERTHIEFSFDGGDHYFPSVPDNSGRVEYANLGSGEYNIVARWGNNECPIPVGFLTFDKNNCADLGDRVWEDLNANGIQEVNEPGVPEVWVLLQDGTGQTIAFTQTDEQGAYEFNTIKPNNYALSFIPPADYYPVQPFQGEDPEMDSDIDPITQRATALDLSEGGTFNSVDAGYFRMGSIAGTVWMDENENGQREIEEVVIPSIKVSLWDDNNNLIQEKQTNQNGQYQFTQLKPSNYIVKIELPNGYHWTKYTELASNNNDILPNLGQTQTLTILSNTHLANIDAGVVNPCGLLRPSLIAEQPADRYLCEEPYFLLPISYLLEEPLDLPDNYKIRYLLTLNDDPTILMTNETPHFNLLKTGALQGHIHALIYNDDVENVNYFDINQIKTGATTLSDIPSMINTPFQCAQLFQSLSSFEFIVCPIMGNLVFDDLNQNGLREPEEPGIPGITVRLRDANSDELLKEAITSTHGNYYFEYRPGSFVIEVVPPADRGLTYKGVGENDAIDSDFDQVNYRTEPLVMGAGDFNLDLDAGIAEPCFVEACKLTLDQPNIQYTCELHQSTISATPYGPEIPPGFDALYLITEGSSLLIEKYGENPSFEVTKPNPGTCFMHCFVFNATPGNPNYFDVNLMDQFTTMYDLQAYIQNQNLCADVDMGGTEITFVACGSIGDLVFDDTNANGIQEVGETGLGNVEVKLISTTDKSRIETTTTDNDGRYSFYVRPDDYILQFTPSSAYHGSPRNMGSDPLTDSNIYPSSNQTGLIQLQANQFIFDIDAGFYEYGKIGDLVWNDANANGIQEDELGLPGVEVSLLNELGETIQTTTTAWNGYYEFNFLPPASYQIKINAPEGYQFSPKDNTHDDLLDSDVGHATGLSGLINLANGQYINTLDAGLFTLACDFDYQLTRATPANLYTCEIQAQTIQLTAGIDEHISLPREFTAQFILTTGTTERIAAISSQPNFTIDRNAVGTYHIYPFIASSEPTSQFYFDLSSYVTDGKLLSDLEADLAGLDNCIYLDDTGMDFEIGSCGIIGDLVFEDTNGDGLQEAGQQPGVSGVTVYLWKAGEENPVQTTTTNGSGRYAFLVGGGQYQLSVDLPEGYTISPANQGENEKNSDLIPETGRTYEVTILGEQDINLDMDMGLVPVQNLSGAFTDKSEQRLSRKYANSGKVNQKPLNSAQYFENEASETTSPLTNYWPNPFRDFLNIAFELEEEQLVEIYIFDAMGRQIDQFSGHCTRGYHKITINTTNWPASSLYLKTTLDKKQITKKLAHIK